jgi:hypothetical protein
MAATAGRALPPAAMVTEHGFEEEKSGQGNVAKIQTIGGDQGDKIFLGSTLNVARLCSLIIKIINNSQTPQRKVNFEHFIVI